MPEMMCSRCKETFRYDKNDEDRPYIYHECPDGILFGHKNSKPKRRPPVHKKKTVWQTFVDKPDSNLDKYKDEDIERWV